MKAKLMLLPLAALAAFLLLCAAGSGEKAKLTGQIKIYGSEPHTWAGIEADGGKVYAVEKANEPELRLLQGKRLQFTVKILPEKPAFPGVEARVQVLSWKALSK